MTPERLAELDRVLKGGGQAIVIQRGYILVTADEIEEYRKSHPMRPAPAVDQSWRDWFSGWLS